MKIFIRYTFLFIFVFQSNAQIADFDTVNFDKADKIALEYKDERLTNLPELAHKLTTELSTDAERFRAIFKWVCSNVANDYHLYSKNKRKRQRYKNDSLRLKDWNDNFNKVVFKKLLKDRKTICTGYAYLIKELANLAAIDCEIVHGFARTSTMNIKNLDTPNHSWNSVKLNGKWYLCDPTWASGIPNPSSAQFQFQFNDGFFLSDPHIFSVNHFPIDKKWFLLGEKTPSFETFLEAPIIYGQAYAYFNSHNMPKKLENVVYKNEPVVFKYQLQKEIAEEDVIFVIETSFKEKKVKPQLVTIKDQLLTIDYKFQTTGYYDVHLYIKKNLIATYTFEVKKATTK
ncbi:transglutaminase domain-containing protein [Kordia sp.]|uniref:transglutaminase domain-containing protein n=1 Tax=Kordia sp. TaxID=1965332 RepID=UPI003B5CF3AA